MRTQSEVLAGLIDVMDAYVGSVSDILGHLEAGIDPDGEYARFGPIQEAHEKAKSSFANLKIELAEIDRKELASK